MNFEEIKKLLEKELADLEHDLQELEEEREDLSEIEVKEKSDAALRYEMQEDYHLVKETLTERLSQVKRALAKIAEKNYGFCDKCQNQIEEGRLNLDPATILCKNCALQGK